MTKEFKKLIDSRVIQCIVYARYTVRNHSFIWLTKVSHILTNRPNLGSHKIITSIANFTNFFSQSLILIGVGCMGAKNKNP